MNTSLWNPITIELLRILQLLIVSLKLQNVFGSVFPAFIYFRVHNFRWKIQAPNSQNLYSNSKRSKVKFKLWNSDLNIQTHDALRSEHFNFSMSKQREEGFHFGLTAHPWYPRCLLQNVTVWMSPPFLLDLNWAYCIWAIWIVYVNFLSELVNLNNIQYTFCNLLFLVSTSSWGETSGSLATTQMRLH